jgi:hypothetical protein
LVFQDKVDKPAGRGVVLRPCAKSSITIPREVERNAFEQEAILNSVYKAYRGPVGTFIFQRVERNLHLWSCWHHSRT